MGYYRTIGFELFFQSYFICQIPDWNNAVIVAKNPLVAKRASSYAERLRVGIAFMHGEVKEDEDEEDGRASPPPFQPGAQQPPHNPSLSDRSVPMY